MYLHSDLAIGESELQRRQERIGARQSQDGQQAGVDDQIVIHVLLTLIRHPGSCPADMVSPEPLCRWNATAFLIFEIIAAETKRKTKMAKTHTVREAQVMLPYAEALRGCSRNCRVARNGTNGRKGQRGIAQASQLILVIVVLAVVSFFGYRYFSTPQGAQVISEGIAPDRQLGAGIDNSGLGPAAQAYTEADVKEAGDTPKARVPDKTTGPGSMAPVISAQPNAPRAREIAPVPVYDLAHAQELVKGLAQFNPPDGKLLPLDVEEINRALEELRAQGPAAAAAIEEFLISGQDVNFSEWSSGQDLTHSTLRLALIDTLGKIGGSEALDAMARMLPAVIDPREIAALAEGLEGNAPGMYRTDIVDATRETLALALESDPTEFQDLGHLFGVIQGYGDDTMAADLDEVFRSTESAWAEYSLMALSRLPEGQGVPYLVGITNEMSADPNRTASNYTMALRMLAQAAREDTQAADALIQLSQGGKLDTSALVSVAATLGGREYQLITAGSEMSENTKAPTFLNGRAPETWTDGEIEQRFVLIDQLLHADADPAVAEALIKAQERLLAWKERPMVNGKRVSLK